MDAWWWILAVWFGVYFGVALVAIWVGLWVYRRGYGPDDATGADLLGFAILWPAALPLLLVSWVVRESADRALEAANRAVERAVEARSLCLERRKLQRRGAADNLPIPHGGSE